MHDVEQRNRLGMSLLEQFDAFFQVRTAIIEDRQRHAPAPGKFTQLIVDDRAVGDFRGKQSQHIDVLVLQRTVKSRERLGANPQHDKAFERTGGDHVIHDPDEIGAGLPRLVDLIEPDSQEVVLDGGMTEAIEPMAADKLTDQSADSRSGSHRDGPFDHHPQYERDQFERKSAAGNLGASQQLA